MKIESRVSAGLRVKVPLDTGELTADTRLLSAINF